MKTICPCCLTEYDDHDSPAEYARVNKQNTMNQTKHTPGPWEFLINPIIVRPVKPGELRICKIDMSRGGDEAEGNARLISAAPELLKLLKDCHNVLFQFPDYQEGNLCDDVKSAIAKAEGSAK